MSSPEAWTKALRDIEPCHFPSLVHEAAASPTAEYFSTSLMLPAIPRPGSATGELLREDEVCKLAFVLLLRAYIRTDSVSCAFVRRGSPTKSTTVHNVLQAHLDAGATLFDNSRQQLSTIQLDAPQDVHQVEAGAGSSKPFNTTLCLIMQQEQHEVDQQQFSDDDLDSDLILRIEQSSPAAGADNHHRAKKATLSYKTDFLDQWYAQNILATFETILQTMAADITRPLKSVNPISPRDLQTIHSWNATVPTYVYQTLNEQFEGTFSENAEREAVYTTAGSLTYRGLDDLSTVLAARLMKLGVKPNIVVPIFMSKSRWSVCAIAAVWKAGGALATMDPAYPNERLFAIIDEFGAKVIISDPEQRPRFVERSHVHVVDDVAELPHLLEANGLPVSRAEAWKMSGVKPRDLAVVAFTSGSSGKPKGVLHTHDRLTSEHLSYSWNVEYTNGSRVLQFASYAYIASVGETQRVFSHGATLCVPSEEERLSNLADFARRSRATRSYLTPSVVRTLNPKDVPSLRILCVGGEPIPKDLEEIWGPHVHFIQVYGATEGGFLARDRTSKNHNKKGLCPVGGLAWLVDPDDVDKLVPVGAAGGIVFESHELALGYLNDPEKSAKTFIDPPAWARGRPRAKGCRYLRNGDMGRYEADGSVTVLGRADTQVKINGQRVELGDVESNLRILLPPEWAVVVELVKPGDAPDRPILAAFVRPNKTFAGDARTVFADAKARLEQVLPRHMIPRACVVVEEIPGHYKTDRRQLRNEASELGYKALIASLAVGNGTSERPVPPATEKERVLAELWAIILHQDVDMVGRRQDFISLGGDSLAAIKLVSAARGRNLELTTQQILSHPVLEEMANLAKATSAGLQAISQQSSPSHPDAIVLRATDFQEWAALVGSLNGGWIDHLAYDFSGRLDEARLEKSCKELVQAHSILRTVFKLKEDRVMIEVIPGAIVDFNTHQVRLKELESKTREIYARDRVSPLGKLIARFDLIRASPDRHRLILRLSHAHYDGFCVGTFEKHLKLLYFSQPLPPTLPFHEYARLIHDPTSVRAADEYWRDHLRGSRMPELVKRQKGSREWSTFTNTLNGEFQCPAVRIPSLRFHGINSATIIKAAWALTISALSGSTDVVFGDFISGRQVPIHNVETVVGPCVNFMPLRVQLSDTSTSTAELLGNVQRDLIAAIPHESLGFRHIIQNCTSWGRDARYSSIVNYVNLEDEDEEDSRTHSWTIHANNVESNNSCGDGELLVDSLYEEQQHDKTDLWLLCRRRGAQSGGSDGSETFDLYFRYSRALYRDSALERIASLYREALESLVTSWDGSVQVPRISEEERSLLVPVLNE